MDAFRSLDILVRLRFGSLDILVRVLTETHPIDNGCVNCTFFCFDYVFWRCDGHECPSYIHPAIDQNGDFQQDPPFRSPRRLNLPENSTSLESQMSPQTAFLLRFWLALANVCS